MSENSINFDNKKILKKRLLQQQQKKFYINDIDVNKILVAEKRINTLLGIMIMMLLNHCI